MAERKLHIPTIEDLKRLNEQREVARSIVYSPEVVQKLKDAGFVGAITITFSRNGDGVWTMLNGVAFDGLTVPQLMEPAMASLEVGLTEIAEGQRVAESPNTVKH